MSEKEIIFCKSGGCTAKLGAGVLEHVLERLPKGQKDENLLVGYDSSDDAAVYKLNDSGTTSGICADTRFFSAYGGRSLSVWTDSSHKCLK